MSVLGGLLSGLVVNGLWAGIVWATQKGSQIATGRASIATLLSDNKALGTHLERALATALPIVAADPECARGLENYLESAEALSAIRVLFEARITGEDASPARLAFVNAAGPFVPGLESASLEAIFDSLLPAVGHALQAAIDEGVLSAHEARSELRHKLVLDELAAIPRRVAMLQERPIDRTTLDTFVANYRRQAAVRHAKIKPPHLDTANQVPIDDIYVIPELSGLDPLPHSTTVSMVGLVGAISRTVVLGDPGAGKSTLANKLVHDLAVDSDSSIVPLLVILRDFGLEKKRDPCSILDYLERQSNSRYQVPPPRGALDYILNSGRALVIFDGLDELLETSDRQDIAGDVTLFSSLYPACPVLVTSRSVGYEQAPLDQETYQTVGLAPFDEPRVNEYSRKWFGLQSEYTEAARAELSKNFLRESEIVADLRSNPLMLSLMCNIYSGEHYIPRNRPDVYEKCAMMLFERWDKSRGIAVDLPFEAHVEGTIGHLAHWIYSDPARRAGVTQSRIVDAAASYLREWRYPSDAEAHRASRAFVEFCVGRAWVLTDTGTTSNGERLFQFTHATFLEYFTAAHIVATQWTPEALEAALLPRIERREWDVVAQLAYQKMARKLEGGADLLITSLLNRSLDSPADERWSVLSFIVRSLQYLVPRPSTARLVGSRAMVWCISEAARNRRRGTADGEPDLDEGLTAGESTPAILRALLAVAPDNREAVTAGVGDAVETILRDESRIERSLMWEATLRLPSFGLPRPGEAAVSPKAIDHWRAWGSNLAAEKTAELLADARRDTWSAHEAMQRGLWTLKDLVSAHGVTELFASIPYRIRRNTFFISIAARLSESGLRCLPSQNQQVADDLAAVAHMILSEPRPFLRTPLADVSFFGHGLWDSGEDGALLPPPETVVPELRGAAFAGMLLLYAVALEGSSDPQRRVREWTSTEDARLAAISAILTLRLRPSQRSDCKAILEQLDLQPSHMELITSWLCRQFDFVWSSPPRSARRRRPS